MAETQEIGSQNKLDTPTAHDLKLWRNEIVSFADIKDIPPDGQRELACGLDEVWSFAKESYGFDDQKDPVYTDYRSIRGERAEVKMFETNQPDVYAQIKTVTHPGKEPIILRSLVKLGTRANAGFRQQITGRPR